MHPRLSALAAMRLTDPDEKVAATRALATHIASETIADEPVRVPGDELGVPGRPERPLRVSAMAVGKRSPFNTDGRAALVVAHRLRELLRHAEPVLRLRIS